MARTLRRRPLLSRLLTTYLTLVVVVTFTGILGAVPVSFAEESNPEAIESMVASGGSEESSGAVAPAGEPLEGDPEPEVVVVEAEEAPAPPVEEIEAPEASALMMAPAAEEISPMLAEPGTGHKTVKAQGYNRFSGWTSGNLGKNYSEGDWVPYRIVIQNTGTEDASTEELIIGFDHYSSTGEAVFVDETRMWGYAISATEPSNDLPDTPPAGFIALTPTSQDVGVQGESAMIVTTIAECSFIIPAGQYATVYFQAHLATTMEWMPRQGSMGAGGYPGSSGQVYLLHEGNRTIPLPAVEVPGGIISVYKFYDTDKDGVKDADETQFLSGWDIHLSDGTPIGTVTTDADGLAYFDYLPAGTYYVSETLKDGWGSNTAQPITVVIAEGESKTVYIGNFELMPSLAIDKSTTTMSYSAVGDVIQYSYKVTNDGEVTLSAPWAVLDDTVVGAIDVSTAPATLAPGAHFTVTASYTVTQADIDAGFVTNIAYATGTYGQETVTSPTDTVTVLGTQDPGLTLVKLATPQTYDAVSDEITYTYRLTNSGNVTLMGPFTVHDDKATVTPVGMLPMVLAPGAYIDFEATYTITQADLDAGSVTNTAMGHGYYGEEEIDSNEDDETVTAVQDPELTLAKTASPAFYDSVGDIITYSYTLTNSGNVTLYGPFTVDDDKATTSRVGVVPDPDVLAPGASITFTAAYVITQADLDAGSVTNIAVGHGYFDDEEITVVDSNEDDETVIADEFLGFPDLGVEKSADRTKADPGDTITYTVAITNFGSAAVSNYVVEDTFDQRYLAVVDAVGGVISNGKITWTFAEPLAAGATRTITYKMLVSQTMPDGNTQVDNWVWVAHPDDNNPDNNLSTWRVTVEEEPFLPFTEPFLPFTGADLIGLLALAGVAAATGTALRRRSRKAA